MLWASDLALAFSDGLLGLDLQRVLDQLDLPIEAGFMLLALAQEVGPEVGLLLPLADAVEEVVQRVPVLLELRQPLAVLLRGADVVAEGAEGQLPPELPVLLLELREPFLFVHRWTFLVELLGQVLDHPVLLLAQLLVQLHLLTHVPGGLGITVAKPSRIALVADRLVSVLGLLELLHQQPLLLMDGLDPVLEPLGVLPPHLHLLRAVDGPVLAEVLHILLGLFVVLPQLGDDPSQSQLLGHQVFTVLLGGPHVLVEPLVELLLLDLPQVVGVVAVDALVVLQALDSIPDYRDLLL